MGCVGLGFFCGGVLGYLGRVCFGFGCFYFVVLGVRIFLVEILVLGVIVLWGGSRGEW